MLECNDCGANDSCGTYLHKYTGSSKLECQNYCVANEKCRLAEYYSDSGSCKLYDCGATKTLSGAVVIQFESCGKKVYKIYLQPKLTAVPQNATSGSETLDCRQIIKVNLISQRYRISLKFECRCNLSIPYRGHIYVSTIGKLKNVRHNR